MCLKPMEAYFRRRGPKNNKTILPWRTSNRFRQPPPSARPAQSGPVYGETKDA